MGFSVLIIAFSGTSSGSGVPDASALWLYTFAGLCEYSLRRFGFFI